MEKQTPRDFNKLAFSKKRKLNIIWVILTGFRKEFGTVHGIKLFFKVITSMKATQNEIITKGKDIPNDKILELAAMALSMYRVVNNELQNSEATMAALKRAYVNPYSEYMCSVLMSSPDAEFSEVLAFFDWGFGQFSNWIKRNQLRNDNSHYDFDITFCKFADTFNRMGCPEVTPLICEMDIGLYRNLKKITMQRTGTIGMGNKLCDFRFSKIDKNDD